MFYLKYLVLILKRWLFSKEIVNKISWWTFSSDKKEKKKEKKEKDRKDGRLHKQAIAAIGVALIAMGEDIGS